MLVPRGSWGLSAGVPGRKAGGRYRGRLRAPGFRGCGASRAALRSPGETLDRPGPRSRVWRRCGGFGDPVSLRPVCGGEASGPSLRSGLNWTHSSPRLTSFASGVTLCCPSRPHHKVAKRPRGVAWCNLGACRLACVARLARGYCRGSADFSTWPGRAAYQATKRRSGEDRRASITVAGNLDSAT